jgi:site-specific recombinase XerD
LTGFPDINNISPKSIINFIKKYSSYYKSKSLQVIISSLQSLFNYLDFKGYDTKKLLASIPKIPNWRLSEIPSYFNDEEIKKILLSFDRATLSGKRAKSVMIIFSPLQHDQSFQE